MPIRHVGAACGGFYANSLVRGAWRLSGALSHLPLRENASNSMDLHVQVDLPKAVMALSGVRRCHAFTRSFRSNRMHLSMAGRALCRIRE